MKNLVTIFLMCITSQLLWSQGTTPRQFEVEVNAPTAGVGHIANLSEKGFAGLYYQSGTDLQGWLGYVGNGGWSDTSTFQMGSFVKPMHFLYKGRAMVIDTAEIIMSRPLHVEAAHNVLFGDSMTNVGTKMMWIPEKAALRAGIATNANWDTINIGMNSTAFGKSTFAKGERAMAFGLFSRAEGLNATAFGSSSRATGNSSTAWGFSTNALNNEATAWGVSTTASGLFSTVWGNNNKAQSMSETVIGSFAEIIAGANPNSFVSTDQLFAVGNGTDDANRHNALTVYKNGNTRVGGALVMDPGEIEVSSNGQTIDVSSTSFARVSNLLSNNPTAVTLGDGSYIGQVLVVILTNGPRIQISHNDNTKLPVASRDVNNDDTLQLIWDGGDWLELSFSAN